MTLSTIINIAVTLIFIYLAFSFIILAIQERIFFNLKANKLKDFIYELLGEEQQKNKSDKSDSLTERFFNKYLILSANPSQSSKVKQQKVLISKKLERIPAEEFVANLITLVAEILNYEDGDFYNKYELTQIMEDIKNSDYFSEKIKLEFSRMARTAINRFQDKKEQINYLDKQLQSWYNRSIEEALEIDDRESKNISIILSVIIVLMFNIDTVNIIDNLSKSEITSNISNTITEVMVSNSQSTPCSDLDNDTELDCIQDQVTTTMMALDRIDIFPIGWNFSEPLKEQFKPLDFPHIIKAVTGWILSIIAISQGAPFWFNILNDLINFKSSKSAKN
ncbi:MAG: hypothetical protein F6K54_35775 [Okeania sp. SIO3B5]|uniref:hypothetical protein n=1 Tax=Okeania sp. SIO3B5 TaxID=2607811 RepID=UPI0013FEBC64|nr:hypothetical protein [Okeania sp. SIO3B5]NEO57948.1 hypothetical protein [Okeania sp. SIO3B5]